MHYFKDKIHPAWLMLFLCLLMTTTSSLGAAAVATNLTIIRQYGGYTATETSLFNTIRMLCAVLTLTISSKIYRRFSFKTIIFTAMLIEMAAFVIIAFLGSYLFALYFAAVLLGLIMHFVWLMSASYLIDRWFASNIGLAVSIVSSGSGFGSLIFAPLITSWNNRLGFTAAFLIQAGIILAVAILILLFLKNDPSELGIAPYGKCDEPSTLTTAASDTGASYDYKKYIGILIAVCFLVGFGSAPSSAHLSLNYTYMGMDSKAVALGISVYGIILIISKLVCGRTNDKIGTRKMTLIFGVLQIIGMMCQFVSMFIPTIAFMFFALVAFGIGTPVQTIGYPNWAREFSNRDTYTTTFKNIQLGTSCGELLGSVIVGLVADAFGCYNYAYLMFSITMFIAFITVLLLYKIKGADNATS